jgi:Tfp pilus assembly protein PilF
MSLIADALKRAQREKQRRESGARPAVSPILVPLRTQIAPRFNWIRALVIGVGVFAIVLAAGMIVRGMKKPSTLATLPAVASPLAGTPLLADPPPVAARPGPRITGPRISTTGPRISTARPGQPTATAAARVAVVPTRPSSTPIDSSTVLQGQPRSGDPNPSVATDPASGRLRIAMEQPRQPEAARLFAEAFVAHKNGEFAVARALYERVLFLAPNHADALNNLGVLLSSQREFDRALPLLKRAASLAPQNAGIWNNIGALLREQGLQNDATVAFQHALAIDPQHQGAKVGLAQQYIAAGSVAPARDLLEQVLVTNPSLAEAHYALGQVLELQGDRAGAIREFSAFIRFAPPRLVGHLDRVRKHVDSLSVRAP